MSYNNIVSNISKLSESQLRSLNGLVIEQLKMIRSIESAEKRAILREGDRVSWSGRHGYTEGSIIRVKRKKAICSVGHGRNWDVPLNMLTLVPTS